MKERHILVVDDAPDSLALLAATLRSDGHQVTTASNGFEALDVLKRTTPDLVLMDFMMPGMDGLQTLKVLRQRESYIAVVFVSARSAKDHVVHVLDSGADDYICKPYDPEEIQARVRVQLRIKDLHDRLAEANRRLQEQVETDELTGLFNMRSMYDRMEEALKRARRYKRTVAVLMVDLDHFKRVNDENDHLFGSHVLSEMGALIRHQVRSTDLAARFGGDEFLIVLTETSPNGAHVFAHRLCTAIAEREFRSGEHHTRLTASVGLATSDQAPDADARTLLRIADEALYKAKDAGRNQVVGGKP